MAIINLVKVGQQLAMTATSIHKAVDATGNAVDLPASKLTGKIPELAKLKDLKVFRIYKSKVGAYESQTMAIYLDDNGKPAVFSATFEPLPGKVEFTTFKTGLNGFQRFKYDGVEFEISTSISDDYRDALVSWGVVEGEGTPEPQFLADVPHFTTPLKDLPKETEFKVLKSTGTDKKFNSVRYLIQNTSTKEEFEVFENADLRDMVAEHGFKAKFKVGSVTKKQHKNGDADTFFVRLVDLNYATFEDIAI